MKAANEHRGFSMVEIIIVIAIMAILTAALTPQLIKYIRKSRRVTDIQAANEIQASFTRAFITMTNDEISIPDDDTGDVYIRNDSSFSDPPQALVDYAYVELGTIPLSSTDSNYYWHVEYEPSTGKVNKIYLSDGPGGTVSHEVYPDSDTFAEQGK